MLTNDLEQLVKQRVHSYYWEEDINCASTTLKLLSELLDLHVHPQVIHAAAGMHGAGKYGAQCGLVEGALMFIGIIGHERGHGPQEIEEFCFHYARSFEDRFGSLDCRKLRPEGFKLTNPPHLCEDLTVRSIIFSFEYLSDIFRIF